MELNIWNSIIIAGIIQGFIFTCIVLFNKKYHAKSTYFLVGLILIYSISNLTYILPDIGVMSLYTMYNTLFIPFASIIPVMIYFYVVFFLNTHKILQLRDKLLFLPFCVLLILTLFFRIKYFTGSKEDVLEPFYIKVILFNETFSVIYSIVLLTISIIRIYKAQKQMKVFDAKIIHHDLKWLFITIAVILFFTFYWAYLTYLNIYSEQSGQVSFYFLWIVVAALIYWLGHIGIYKYGLITERKKIRLDLEKSKVFQKAPTSSNESNSKFDNEYLEQLDHKLIKDKIYLDPNLSLHSISEELQISPSYLSRMINSELGISFPDYLNSFRINEAKIYLQNPEFSKYTITAIGLEAGFNSKSAFYDVFKKCTGKTPAAYKKEFNQPSK